MHIKHFIGTALLVFAVLFSTHAQYIEIWSDEFDYTGLPDPQKWSYDTGGNGFGNEEKQYYTRDRLKNARVEDGKLIIEAHKESFEANEYTSAKLQTLNSASWQYGRFEIRAKLPKGRGIWPAIWMLPSQSVYGSWPASGEIDIMEQVGFEPDKVHFTIHTEAYNHKIGTQIGANAVFNKPYDNFHTYALEWTEDSLRFYVNDVLYFSFLREPDGDYTVWPYKHPFYLILNVAVGGSWGGANGIDNTIFPQRMEVDYVRVYKKAEPGSSFTIRTSAVNGSVRLAPEQETYTRGSMVKATAIPDEGYQFEGWYGTYESSSPDVTFPMYFNYDVTAGFVRTGEMIKNGNFRNSTLAWSFYGSNIKAENTSAHIPIPQETANTWDIQLSQSGLSLESGATYELKLKARATAERRLTVGTGISEEPWTTFFQKTISLDIETEEYSFQFTMPRNESNGRVIFDMGGYAGDIYLTDISLFKIKDGVTGKSTGMKKDHIRIFPNPSNGRVKITGEAQPFQLLDQTGRQTGSGTVPTSLNLSSYPKGLYFVQTSEGSVHKLILE